MCCIEIGRGLASFPLRFYLVQVSCRMAVSPPLWIVLQPAGASVANLAADGDQSKHQIENERQQKDHDEDRGKNKRNTMRN